MRAPLGLVVSLLHCSHTSGAKANSLYEPLSTPHCNTQHRQWAQFGAPPVARRVIANVPGLGFHGEQDTPSSRCSPWLPVLVGA